MFLKASCIKSVAEDESQFDSSHCSCAECDSLHCFAIRHKITNNQCTCPKCNNLNTCLYSCNNNAKVDKDILDAVNIKSNQSPKINKKPSNRKVETELKIDFKDDSEQDPQEDGKFIKELFENKFFYDENQNIQKSTRKQSYNSISRVTDNVGEFYDGVINGILSKHKPYSCTELGSSNKETNSTAKLSAQVMNLPYSNFKDSLTRRRNVNNDKLSIYNIFQRIKEAYQACSCKVCECITGKSLPTKNDLCKCKPCDCKDCMTFMSKFPFGKYCNAEIGSQNCNCKPCDCIKCTGLNPSCDCEPCQCTDCKSSFINKGNTVIVASVEEERPACQCSPCECAQCGGHGYPFATNLMREMSTGINRHPQCRCETCVNEACEPDGNDSCRCERRDGVIRKPVNNNTQDYDIRSIVLSNNRRSKPSKYNALAMFAAVSTTYPIGATNKNRQECECKECDCLVCCNQEKNESIIKSLQCVKSLLKIPEVSQVNKSACSCTPCECQMCKYKNSAIDEFQREARCKCSKCDCIECDKIEASDINMILFNQTDKILNSGCHCSPCECTNCTNLIRKKIGDVCHCSKCTCEQCLNDILSNKSVYPVKKGTILTPDIMFNNSLCRDLCTTLSTKDMTSTVKQSVEAMSLNKDLGTKKESHKQSIYHVCPENVHFTKSSLSPINSSNFAIELSIKNTVSKVADINMVQPKKKYNICEQTKKETETKKYSKEKDAKCQVFFNYTGESYFESPSKLSCCKENGTVTPSRRYATKSLTSSWKSSCNSSGYDDSDYLIQFPRTPIENCINDVLKLDFNNNFNGNIETNKMCYDKKPVLSTAYYGNYKVNDPRRENKVLQKRDLNNPDSFISLENRFDTSNLQCSYNSSANCASYSNQELSIKKCDINTEDTDIHVIQKLKGLTNFMEEHHPETNNISPQYPPNTHLNNSPFVKNNNGSNNIEEDYIRAQNTLREAKAFSIELMGILEKYEKANREFKSVVHRLQLSHDLNLNVVNHKTIRNDAVKYSTPEFGYDRGVYITLEQEVSVLNQSYSEREEPIKQLKHHIDNDEDKIIKNNDNLKVNEICDILINIPKKINECKEYTHLEKKSDCIINKTVENIPRKFKDMKLLNQDNDNITVESNTFDTPSTSTNVESAKKLRDIKGTNQNRNSKENHLKNNKKYVKLIKRTVTCKRIKKNTGSKTSDACKNGKKEIKTFKDYHENEILKVNRHKNENEVLEKSDNATNHSQEVTTSTSVDRTITENFEDTEESKLQILEKKPWAVLKKNLYLNNKYYTKSREFTLFPLLASEIKEAVRSVSLQTMNDSIYLSGKENKALATLQVIVREVLNMPQLQQFHSKSDEENQIINGSLYSHPKDEVHHEITDLLNTTVRHLLEEKNKIEKCESVVKCDTEELNNNSSKSSCEFLRVGSLGVRRVSDHTVLVKWKVPHNMADVRGYELLVDGRAVQKIFSPSRSMAVVTCLPHTDSILITIRTLTSSISQNTHYPASTIVYRPRVK